MAVILRTPALLLPSSRLGVSSVETPRALVSFSSKQRIANPLQLKTPHVPLMQSLPFPSFVPLATSGETAETKELEEEMTETEELDDEASVNDSDIADADEKSASLVTASLQSYKEALVNDDQYTVATIEAFLRSVEDEKYSLANKVAVLSAELSTERDRVIRISADFDNFRKRTERERLSLMTNVQGEVVESLLPVLDNFERAKAQIKVETEGEEKINDSYQSIYKQFQEVLTSLGVEAVESVGFAFDPLLHEAIMRGDSTEYDEGIIIQEFRKGFKLGERLLRPSMVKVSAGPGPEMSVEDEIPPADDGFPASGKNQNGESDEGVDDGDSD